LILELSGIETRRKSSHPWKSHSSFWQASVLLKIKLEKKGEKKRKKKKNLRLNGRGWR
jgi:hypothetical protein